MICPPHARRGLRTAALGSCAESAAPGLPRFPSPGQHHQSTPRGACHPPPTYIMKPKPPIPAASTCGCAREISICRRAGLGAARYPPTASSSRASSPTETNFAIGTESGSAERPQRREYVRLFGPRSFPCGGRGLGPALGLVPRVPRVRGSLANSAHRLKLRSSSSSSARASSGSIDRDALADRIGEPRRDAHQLLARLVVDQGRLGERAHEPLQDPGVAAISGSARSGVASRGSSVTACAP